MQTYDAFSRTPSPYQSQIPAMRSPYDPVAGSGTPIYDALYSEYRRLFRALPGDRTGEEELRFEGFHSIRAIQPIQAFQPAQTVQRWQPHLPQAYAYPYNGRHRGAVPAALPPAPRDGGRR